MKNETITTANTEENIKELHEKGYKKSIVNKPYGSHVPYIRYNTRRKVYWFTFRNLKNVILSEY